MALTATAVREDRMDVSAGSTEPQETHHPWYSEHRHQRRFLDQFGDDHTGRNRILH